MRYVYEFSGNDARIAMRAFSTFAGWQNWTNDEEVQEYNRFNDSYIWDVSELIEEVAEVTNDLHMWRFAQRCRDWRP